MDSLGLVGPCGGLVNKLVLGLSILARRIWEPPSKTLGVTVVL